MEQKVYIAPGAVVTGQVQLGENVSIWYGAVLRGDCGKITVGDNTNIQDGCVLHEETTVGRGCTIGHGAIIHGCKIGDNCLVGMGAILLDGVVLEEHCMVGAGALLTSNTVVPAGTLALGNPAKTFKPLNNVQKEYIYMDADNYVALAKKQLKKTKKGKVI